MSRVVTVKGARAEVAAGELAGGWGWHCHTCDARCGMPSGKRRPDRTPFAAESAPFTDGVIADVDDTAEGHCIRSATLHADKRCAGAKTKVWQPPAYHPEEE